MYYIVDTEKTFEEASAALEAEVKQLGFGVLHIHDLGKTLRSKGKGPNRADQADANAVSSVE